MLAGDSSQDERGRRPRRRPIGERSNLVGQRPLADRRQGTDDQAAADGDREGRRPGCCPSAAYSAVLIADAVPSASWMASPNATDDDRWARTIAVLDPATAHPTSAMTMSPSVSVIAPTVGWAPGNAA